MQHSTNRRASLDGVPSGRRTEATGPEVMAFSLSRELLREIIAEVIAAMPHLDWPEGRLALTEAEAAAACGVSRHVLRDLRLAGHIRARKLGRRVLYTRGDLLAALDTSAP